MFNQNAKKFAVVGLGLFGKRLARELADQGHEVLAIDQNEDPVSAVRNEVEQAVIGDVRQESLFDEFITADFEAVVVTMATNLEASLLSVLHAREKDVGRIIAKSNGPEHTTILRRLAVDEIIMPEEDVADRLAQKIGNPNVHEYMQLRGRHSLIEMVVPDFFVGETLRELNLRTEHQIQVIGVQEGGKGVVNYVPSSSRPFKADDVVWMTGPEEVLQDLSRKE